MHFRLLLAGFVAIVMPVVASAQDTQASAMVLAQAHDRCMRAVAVLESHSETDDGLIYEYAVEACRELDERFHAALRTEYPADQANEIVSMLKAQAKPNFLSMLGRIRANRAARGAPQ